MPKPKALTRCVANSYTGPDDRVIEFSNGSRFADMHRGGLISLRNLPSGVLRVEVYQCSEEGVEVVAPRADVLRQAAKDMEGGSLADQLQTAKTCS